MLDVTNESVDHEEHSDDDADDVEEEVQKQSETTFDLRKEDE